MSNVVVRSIFQTTVVERSWKTSITSGIVHILVIGLAFLVTVPVVNQLHNPAAEHITLLAPVIPHPHPSIQPPRIPPVARLKAPVVLPPVKLPEVAKILPPPVVPVAPIVRPTPAQPKIVAEAKPVIAPAPKPALKLNTFEDLQTAKAAPAPKQVVVGGFGDPRGVQASETPRPQPVLMAKVGSFDGPTGSGQTGGGGHLESGVRQSGFGNVGVTKGATNGQGSVGVRTGNFGDGSAQGPGHSSNGVVRQTGFGDTLAAAPQHKDAPTSVAAFTPVEILFKPRPSYSEEARGMRLEGQVSLEVVFQASGAVKVVRIIKGLGHGLDEAAQQAALHVKFKPATRGGAPVDTSATISITFELT